MSTTVERVLIYEALEKDKIYRDNKKKERSDKKRALQIEKLRTRSQFSSSKKVATQKKNIVRGKIPVRHKSTGEKQVFENIRNTRKHICTNCDKYITEPASRCFAHLLAKGMYPQYRLYENNIALVCSIDCHHSIDTKILGHKIRIQQLLELGTSFIGIANAIGLKKPVIYEQGQNLNFGVG